MRMHYSVLSYKVFGSLSRKLASWFLAQKKYIAQAGIKESAEQWGAVAFFSGLIAFVAPLAAVILAYYAGLMGVIAFVYLVFTVPGACAAVTFLGVYYYPQQKAKNIANSIELELPFALSQMAAIASSGVSIESMFELVSGFEEYKSISGQAGAIVADVKELGMSSSNAIEHLAKRTPSKQFREILEGIASTVEKGGNLTKYLTEMSEKSLSQYKTRRDEYQKSLAIMSEIYMVLSIAAPFMMLFVLSSLLIASGSIDGVSPNVLGFSVEYMIAVVMPVFVIVSNLGFLGFLHFSQPGV